MYDELTQVDIDKMKADYINEIRSRKHDMMPHLRQLSSARKNLWYYLSHKDQFTDDELRALLALLTSNQSVDYSKFDREKMLVRLNEARENRVLFKNIKY